MRGRAAATRTTPATAVLIFVLAGVVAADPHFASMATHTRGLQQACATEYQACVADSACFECNYPPGCEVQQLDDTTCDDLDETVCCHLGVDEECANNEAYITFIGGCWSLCDAFERSGAWHG